MRGNNVLYKIQIVYIITIDAVVKYAKGLGKFNNLFSLSVLAKNFS